MPLKISGIFIVILAIFIVIDLLDPSKENLDFGKPSVAYINANLIIYFIIGGAFLGFIGKCLFLIKTSK